MRKRRSRGGIHAAAAAIVMTAGLGAVGVAGAQAPATTIDAENDKWVPDSVAVAPGETVQWTFDGETVPHNLKSTSANWDVDTPFGTAQEPIEYTFSAPGVYTFVCEVHPGTMTGSVTVGDATPTPTPTPSASPTATPTPTPNPPASPPPTTDGHTTTPAPDGGTDETKPRVRRVRLKAKRRAVQVRFRLSEPATVTLRVKRRGSRRVLESAVVQAPKGSHRVTLRSKRLKKGRYTVEVRARDAFGNRSKTVRERLSLRR